MSAAAVGKSINPPKQSDNIDTNGIYPKLEEHDNLSLKTISHYVKDTLSTVILSSPKQKSSDFDFAKTDIDSERMNNLSTYNASQVPTNDPNNNESQLNLHDTMQEQISDGTRMRNTSPTKLDLNSTNPTNNADKDPLPYVNCNNDKASNGFVANKPGSNPNDGFVNIELANKTSEHDNTGDSKEENTAERKNSILSKFSNKRHTKLLKGISLTILSGFCFSITSACVKSVKDLNPATMAIFRYMGIVAFSLPLLVSANQSFIPPAGSKIWIIFRGLAGGTSVFFRYSALQYISLADTTIIVLSMPVFVFVFARIFLKENFDRYHGLSLCLSIIGILFASNISTFTNILSPSSPTTNGTDSPLSNGFMTTTESSVTNDDDESILSKLFHSSRVVGTLYSLGSMLVGSLVYILMRKVKSVHRSVVLINFAIISTLEMTVIDYFFFDFNLPQIGNTPYMIMVVAVFSFYAQFLLTTALQIEEAGIVSVIRISSEALFAFIFQIIFFREIPSAFSVIGAVLVLSSVFLLSFRKYLIGLPDDNKLKKRFRFLAK